MNKSLFVYLLLVAMLDIQICSQCRTVIRLVKVSYSRKEILVSSNLPKNELVNLNFWPSLLGQKFFVQFLEELKKECSFQFI